MKKTKKELFEENRKLKRINKNLENRNKELLEKLSAYSEFWEIDALKECTKQLRFAKKSIYVISVILLIISAFLIGLAN